MSAVLLDTCAAAWLAEGIALDKGVQELLLEAATEDGVVVSADRFLLATARQMNIPLVTRDRVMLRYAEAGHVRCIPC